MLYIGHRACMDDGPENSLTAIRRASRFVDRLELDVRRCGSGELVLHRDEHLTRLFGVDRPIAEVPYDELRELRINDSEDHLPLLSEALSNIPDGVGAHIELKSPALIPDAKKQLESSPVDVTIITGDTAVLDAIDDADWSVNTGFVFYDYEQVDAHVQTAIEYGCESIEMHFINAWGTSLVETAIDNDIEIIAGGGGLDPHVCGIHDELLVRKLEAIGVDGIMVDSWEPIVDGTLP